MSNGPGYLPPAQFDALDRVASGDLTRGSDDARTSSLLRTLLRKGLVARWIHAPVGVTWSVTPAGQERLDRRREWRGHMAGQWAEVFAVGS